MFRLLSIDGKRNEDDTLSSLSHLYTKKQVHYDILCLFKHQLFICSTETIVNHQNIIATTTAKLSKAKMGIPRKDLIAEFLWVVCGGVVVLAAAGVVV